MITFESDSRTPRYVPVSPQAASGAPVHAELKCWLYSLRGSTVFVQWEFRRFATLGCIIPPTHELHDLARNKKDEWDEVLTSLGVDLTHAITGSRQQVDAQQRKRKLEPVLNPLVRSEWGISTHAALSLLVHMSCTGKKTRRRSCANVLSAWLESVCGNRDFLRGLSARLQLLWRNGPCDFWHDKGSCSHRLGIKAGDTCSTMVGALLSLYARLDVCPSASPLLIECLKIMTAYIDENIEDHSNDNIVHSHERDPDYDKKRRTDEDEKQWVLGKCRSENISSGKYASSHGCGAARSATTWEHSEACFQLSANYSSFQQSQCIGIALDGKKLGNPAEDTEAFGACDPDSGFACWLPLQEWVDAFPLSFVSK
jgi:hypothetical protein